MAARDREQLVISLGEGPEGQKVREAIDKAAALTGKPTSTWARDLILAEAGGGDADPIAEVLINDREMTSVDLRSVQAMQTGWAGKARGFFAGEWHDMMYRHPDELLARWKRVKRGG